MRLWYLSHRRPVKAQAQSLCCSHTWSMEVGEGSDKKNQTPSPTGWLRMRVWRMSLRRMKSAIISWDGWYWVQDVQKTRSFPDLLFKFRNVLVLPVVLYRNQRSLFRKILSFRKIAQSSLIRVYTVCNSVRIFWTPYSVLKHYCSNFRIFTGFFFSGVMTLRNITVNIFVGGTVHLVCRNRERGEEAKTEIAESTGSQVQRDFVMSIFAGFQV